MSNPYVSPEFKPNAEAMPWGSTAAYFNNQIWLIGADQSGSLHQVTLDLFRQSGKESPQPINIDGGDAADSSQWKRSGLSLPHSFKTEVYSRCAAVPCGTGLYAFWNQCKVQWGSTPVGLLASGYDPEGTGVAQWGSPVTLQDHGGTQVRPHVEFRQDGMVGFEPVAVADVSATALGEDTIIVACASVDGTFLNVSQAMYLGVYNTADIDDNHGFWKARWSGYVSAAQVSIRGAIKDLGHIVSIDWFTAGKTTDEDDAPPQFYLAVFYSPDWAWDDKDFSKGSYSFIPLSLDATTGELVSLQLPNGPQELLQSYRLAAPNGPKPPLAEAPFVVQRDPAGRLVATGRLQGDKDKNLTSLIFSTAAPPQLDQDFPLPYTGFSLPTPTTGGALPSVVSFAFTNEQVADKSQKFDDKYPMTQYPAYQFVFYGSQVQQSIMDSEVRCQVSRYGTAQVIPDCWSGKPGQGNKDNNYPEIVNVLQGIIEGPLPAANENLAGYRSGQTTFGEIAFSAENKQEIDHKVSSEWTVGLEYSGKTTKGLGPAWDIAFKGGTGQASGESESTSTSVAKSCELELDDAGEVEGETLSFRPGGNLFLADPTFYITAFRFLDANGNPVSDPTQGGQSQGARMISVKTAFDDESKDAYTPYAVAPGNLWSYTPQAWDARMQYLAANYPDPSATLYSKDRYLQDVIVPNAHNISGEEHAYANMNWAGQSPIQFDFVADEERFTERSWQFDLKVYTGISGGGGIDVFGMGEEGEFEFLRGVEASFTGSFTTATGTQWGIGVIPEEGAGPPVNDTNTEAVRSYTAHLYFLPVPDQTSSLAPNYWAKELRQYLGKGWGEDHVLQPEGLPSYVKPIMYPEPTMGLDFDANAIDPNSHCWRMLFVVTKIRLNDGTEWEYDDSHGSV